MQEIDLNELGKYVDAVNDIQSNWMLVAAKKDGKVNALTASWGALGSLWRRKVAFIFIRPSRFTKEFIDVSGRFTLTFFNGRKKEMGYLGKTSGRDVPDKIAQAGLTETEVAGMPTFKEGRLMLSCRVLYTDPIEREHFLEKNIDDEVNPDGDRSVIYVGEIEKGYLL
ncbi:MAG: flavin reductase [Candidatus Methanomethylophilus sp.]|nr:flavin reductase [Methanomethylophilus sp.]